MFMDETAVLSNSNVTRFDRWLVSRMLLEMNNPPVNLVLWNGEQFSSATENDNKVSLRFNNRRALIATALNAERNFGDLYAQGDIEVTQGRLVQLIEAVYHSVPIDGWPDHKRKPLLRRLIDHTAANSEARARRNIHHHYDIGNDFYKLWLDEKMQYTCAYFARPDMTLEDAQTAKMDLVCRKLRLQPGQKVVEAGCGWGSFALHMAKNYGVEVTAYNISEEQIQYARERASDEGMSDQVRYVADDYRNITGDHDVFVSIGMLEHVGPAHYEALGRVIDRCLKPNGLGLIHTIGRNNKTTMNPWIERRIFPGAHPPSLKEMMDIFEPPMFSVLDVENLRFHYKLTTAHWLDRFEKHVTEIEDMFDTEFVRTWRMYLSGSTCTFDIGRLQLFQVLFARARNNEIPLTREDIYNTADSFQGES